MDIRILQLLEGAKQAKGLTIIIDVFRAFSTACYAFSLGAKKIIPVGDIKIAYQLREENPGWILMGERQEKKPEGFDFGNSPTLLEENKLKGKTIIHTTSSGTQGIATAMNADEIITGSFVNASAIISYIKSQQPTEVSLVCMGYNCQTPTDEDTFLATYIKNELEGKANNFTTMTERLRTGSGARFFDPDKQEWSPAKDFELCLSLNRFPFILKVVKDEKQNYLRKIDLS